MGRPSIPPERLLRAPLVQILFSVRSERWLMSAPHASTTDLEEGRLGVHVHGGGVQPCTTAGLAAAPTSPMARAGHTRTSFVPCDPAGCRVARMSNAGRARLGRRGNQRDRQRAELNRSTTRRTVGSPGEADIGVFSRPAIGVSLHEAHRVLPEGRAPSSSRRRRRHRPVPVPLRLHRPGPSRSRPARSRR